ncbi:hypothetical protein [Mycolicibacter algericus]|uniref:hypothetical protein n=1 Tax=Mycolicibacter algericus TaxID=1288388 RepID=UPI0019661EFA|nr:hypothetical protein [Mycolicibacter algericus]
MAEFVGEPCVGHGGDAVAAERECCGDLVGAWFAGLVAAGGAEVSEAVAEHFFGVAVLVGGEAAVAVGCGQPDGLGDEPGVSGGGGVGFPVSDDGGHVGAHAWGAPRPGARRGDDLATGAARVGFVVDAGFVEAFVDLIDGQGPAAGRGRGDRHGGGLVVDRAGYAQDAGEVVDVVDLSAAAVSDKRDEAAPAVQQCGRVGDREGFGDGGVVDGPVGLQPVPGCDDD